MSQLILRDCIGRLIFGLCFGVGAVGFFSEQVSGAGPRTPVPQRITQSVYPETEGGIDALLRTAALHTAQQQWEAAIDLLNRAIQKQPNALAPLPAHEFGPATEPIDQPEGFRLYVNVGEFAQRQIAQFPSDALQLFRRSVDGDASRLFRRGREELDRELLQLVVDRYFCSSQGDEATELLGDLAFQEGRFREGLSLYQRLLPPDQAPNGTLTYPDPDPELVARVTAKTLLTRASNGNPPTEDELRRFEERFPDAQGELAGRSQAKLALIVRAALGQDALEPLLSIDSRWSTFTGSLSRAKAVAEPIDPGDLLWELPLRKPFDPTTNLNSNRILSSQTFEIPNNGPSFHPVLMGDEVLVTDGQQVFAFPLSGGPPELSGPPNPSWQGDARNRQQSRPPRTIGIDQHTLTIDGERIYARIGAFGIDDVNGRNRGTAPETAIAAFDRRGHEKPIWVTVPDQVLNATERPLVAAGSRVGFGGAPVVDDQGVYVTMTKPGTQSQTWVACLDPATGRPKWTRFICYATAPAFDRSAGGPRNRGVLYNLDLGHRLLTLDGSTLYYQTDLGALASLDTRTGRINWLATYPRELAAPTDPLVQIGHSPAVVSDDLVMIAPSDADRIFAFHRSTGRLAWEADCRGRVRHLLGVTENRLVATGNHVWTIDLEEGRCLSRWPENPVLIEAQGRGVIAGNEIYWPTSDRIHVLDVETGRPGYRRPIEVRGGNLVADDSYLVIAERFNDQERLRVFCKHGRRIEQLQERIAANPAKAQLYYLLARSAEAIGNEELALEALDQAFSKASSTDRIDGSSLREASARRTFQIYLQRAQRARAQGKLESAVAASRLAETAASEVSDRLGASFLLSDLLLEQGDARGAAAVLQSILEQPRLRNTLVRADDRLELRAELLAIERLRTIIATDGREAYQPWDQEAQELFDRALVAKGDRLQLSSIATNYPVAAAALPAIEKLAEIDESSGRYVEAARSYQQILRESTAAVDTKISALEGLRRCLEALGEVELAREAGDLALNRTGLIEGATSDLLIKNSGTSLAAFGATLGEPPWTRKVLFEGPSSRRNLSSRDLRPTGLRPSSRSHLQIQFDDERLFAISTVNGEELWSLPIRAIPSWGREISGRIILGWPDRLEGIDRESGATVWEFRPPETDLQLGRPAASPLKFGRESGDLEKGHGIQEVYAGFDRLIVTRGSQELIRLDPVSGVPAWIYRSPSSVVDPMIGVGLNRVIVSLTDLDQIAILDSETGETMALFANPTAPNEGPWRVSPLPLTLDRVALVPGADRVAVIDILSGRLIWDAREPTALPQSPRLSAHDPILLGNPEHLIVFRSDRVQRLNPTDGQIIWEVEPGRLRASDRASGIVLGASRLFFIRPSEAGLTLEALDLESGETCWNEPISTDPNEKWSIRLANRTILAYRLEDGLHGESGDEPLVISVLDRNDGRRLQRFVIPKVGPRPEVEVRPDEVVIAGAKRIVTLSTMERNTDQEDRVRDLPLESQ